MQKLTVSSRSNIGPLTCHLNRGGDLSSDSDFSRDPNQTLLTLPAIEVREVMARRVDVMGQAVGQMRIDLFHPCSMSVDAAQGAIGAANCALPALVT
jgi:hypothetical protein